MNQASKEQQEEDCCAELGYLLLEQTPIQLVCEEDRAPRPHAWYPVQLNDGNSSSAEAEACSDSLKQDDAESDCRKCEFVAHFADQTKTLCLPHATTAHDCRCTTRSDGAILFGLLLQLQHDGDIGIVECRALFLDNSLQSVAVYVTICFPRLTAVQHGGNTRRLLVGGTSRTVKTLGSSWQLLLSLLRSDWKVLDKFIASLQEDYNHEAHGFQTTAARKRKPTTLFPPKLSMTELYRRIQGSPWDESQQQKTLDSQLLRQTTSTCALAQLPQELLVKRVSLFLAAVDLDHWRVTCGYFYALLQGRVPGLQLQLYQHQVLSLAWMRERERHELWEKDCLRNKNNSGGASSSSTAEGDLHRAATGGHTVLLRSRKGGDECAFHVDTMTGVEFEANTDATDVISRRKVCRGGLLVDEPGLGTYRCFDPN